MRARLVLLTAVAAVAATMPPAHAAVPFCETVTTSNPPHVVTVCVNVNPATVVLTPVTVIIPMVCVTASVCVGPIPVTFPLVSACADTPDVTIEVDGQPVTFPPLTICV